MVKRIGFIGLGIMGRPMARNLLKAGFELIVHNRSQGPVQALVTEGVRAASSPRAVAELVECLITMLPDSPDVEQVALGPNGIIEGAHPGLIFIDMSTISPLVSKRIARALEAKGVRMLDAPVSGGEKGAIEGALSIMAGGDRTVFEDVLPILQVLGKTVTHVGPVGAGGFTKLANQIIVAGTVTLIAEALTLAAKAGLDIELTLHALAGGSAGSRVLDLKARNYLSHRYNPGFKIDLHFKDLSLVTEAARALGVPLPTTALVQELFKTLRAKGWGGLDNSAVVLLYEELAGTEVRGASASVS